MSKSVSIHPSLVTSSRLVSIVNVQPRSSEMPSTRSKHCQSMSRSATPTIALISGDVTGEINAGDLESSGLEIVDGLLLCSPSISLRGAEPQSGLRIVSDLKTIQRDPSSNGNVIHRAGEEAVLVEASSNLEFASESDVTPSGNRTEKKRPSGAIDQ